MTQGGLTRRVKGRLDAARAARRLAVSITRDLAPPRRAAFARFGDRSVIVPPVRITTPEAIEIGDEVQILEHAWLSVVPALAGITPRLTIGNGTIIGRFCHIACVGEVTFGRDAWASDRVFVGDTYHDYHDPALGVKDQPMAAPEPVHIGDRVFLGIGSSVLMGVTIGDNAYVAAGAVVTRDVEPFTVVAGNPARPLTRFDHATGSWERVDT